MNIRHMALGFVLSALFGSLGAEQASAAMGGPDWRLRQNYVAPPAPTSQPQRNAQVRSGQNFRSYDRNAWNASNTWYNVPSYGNYAPPPYATSRSAFYQVGPVPAFGGVRSLPGWGGAR
jgi:hypothetical protein